MSFGWDSSEASFIISMAFSISGVVCLFVDWIVGEIKHRREWKKDRLTKVGSLAFLVFLLFEITGVAYAWRTHVLDNRATSVWQTESVQYGNKINDQQREIGTLNFRINELHAAQHPRSLTDTQKDAFQSQLTQYHGQNIEVHCVSDDPETKDYANDFASVFTACGWKCEGPVDHVFRVNPFSVFLVINNDDGHANRVAQGIIDLQVMLAEFGITEPGQKIEISPEVSPGRVWLVIGRNPTIKLPPTTQAQTKD